MLQNIQRTMITWCQLCIQDNDRHFEHLSN